MRVFLGRQPLRAAARPRLALAIGNFDGVHQGHRALIRAACQQAAAHQATAGVLTFDPHPARLFAPEQAPPLIDPLPRRLQLLGEAGAEIVVVEPFTAAFAAIEAPCFVHEVLAGDLGAVHVVVGYDFSFGRGRAGDPETLRALGAAAGVGITVVPPVVVDGVVCSSSKVRELVAEGRVEEAALLLGRPVEVSGTVVRGAGRGRDLGIPTANVAPQDQLLPRVGIYAGWAALIADPTSGGAGDGGAPVVSARHRCAISVGTNPTFTTAGTLSVEAYILDFDGDLYGQTLRLQFGRWLRPERRFPTLDSLMAQIHDDIAETRKLGA